MHFFLGLITILYLLLCELGTGSPVQDVFARVVVVALLTAIVPCLAMFQTIVLGRQIRSIELTARQRQSSLRRLDIVHTLIWLATCLMIVGTTQWHNIVRQNWKLDGWLIVDEILILTPIVLSLVASWFIFAQLSTTASSAATPVGNRLRGIINRNRLAYVAVRLRVYFGLTFFPLLVFVLMKDMATSLEHWPGLVVFFSLLISFLFTLGYPGFLQVIWNLRPIEDAGTRARLINICKSQGLRLRRIQVWNTGNQVANAMVAGIVPRFRSIVLTDGLLNRFPKREMEAILLHEIGHIKLWHLPVRIAFILLPLVFMASCESLGLPIISRLDLWLERTGFGVGPAWLVPSILFLLYLLPTLSWLSKKMEFEADTWAAVGTTESDPNDLLDALLRFASYYPDQLHKKTLLHPSLHARMVHVINLRDRRIDRRDFSRRLRKHQFYLLVVVLTVCLWIVSI